MGLNYDVSINEAEAGDDDKYEEITVNKRKIKVRTPDESTLAVLFSRTSGRGTTDAQVLGAVVDFFFSLLDDEDAAYLEKRLMKPKRKDPFSMEHIEQMFHDLMEVWTADPTEE